jgi:hypothetical protein
VSVFLAVAVLGAGVGAGGFVAHSYGAGQGGPKSAALLATAETAREDEEPANDADLKKLQRAAEEQQRLIEEKEKELAKLRELLGGNKPKPPKGDNPLGPGRDAEWADLQRLLGQIGNKNFDPRSLKELLGDKVDLQELQQAADYKKRVVAELEAELARLRGPADSRAKQTDASSEDPREALKKLTGLLQQWADRNRPIEPEEVKKVLAELQQGSQLKELRRRLESQQRILQERDAELADLKQILAELSGKLPRNAPFATEPPSRPQDAEAAKLRKLLEDQENALRKKDEELKILQDALKQYKQGKPKSSDGR